MSIVSSVRTVAPAQKDGRSWVHEVHTDNIGLTYVADYLAAVGANYDAIMSARATALALQIEIAEYVTKIAADASPLPFQYQTAAQFAAKFRIDYQSAIGFSVAYLAYWIINRISAGDFTDAQVQAVFGLTTVAYTTLKTTKFVPQHDAYASGLAAIGA